MALFTIDHVALLFRKLREVQYEARHVGINLGLKNGDIEAVCKQSHKTPHECLQDVFTLWLKLLSKQRTWKILVQALRSGREHVLADGIANRYRSTLDQSVSVPLHDLLSLVKGINTTHWRSLGLYLGLHLSQINEIDDKGEWSEYVMIELLRLWLSGNGKPATLDTLVTAVKELPNIDLADRLRADRELHLSSCSDLTPPVAPTEQNIQGRSLKSDGTLELDTSEAVIQQSSNAHPDDTTAHSDDTTVQDGDTLDFAFTTAMKEGGGKMKPCNITLHGPPGVGKTSLKRLILGLPPLLKEEENSTNIMEKAVRAVSTSRWTRDGTNLLADVNNDEFITMLAQTVGVVNEKIQKKPLPDSTHDNTLEEQEPESASVSPQISSHLEVCKLITEQIPKVDPSNDLFDDDWIHLIDSGGQPQFLDVLPLLFRTESLHIVVTRLDQGLDDKPEVLFHRNGENAYRFPDRLVLTNGQLIERACQMAKAQAISGKVVPKVLVVGTCKDKLGSNSEAKIKKINKELMEVLEKYDDILICKSVDEVIFPINAMAPVGKERQQYTEELQKCILNAAKEIGDKIEVPLKWLVFQLHLDKIGPIVPISECYKTGEKLGMGKREVKEALKYFHKVALLLYYPDDVPDLIFTRMDPLIGRLSRLITASFPGCSVSTPYDRLRQKGLFQKTFLDTVFEGIYRSEELSNNNFLKLLECLKIAVPVENDNYFLPSALSLKPPVDDSPFPMSCAPLVFTWNKQFLPHGFFLTFVVELLQKSTENHYFELIDVTQCRYVLQVTVAKHKIPGDLKLVDKERWIEIRYSCSIVDRKFCSKLREITRDAVKRVVKRFEHTGIEFPELGFRCGLCDKDDHHCVLSDDHTRLICSRTRHSGPVTPEMSCWINSTDSNEEESVSILRDHYAELCKTLTTSESTLLSLNSELYTCRIISQPTMIDVRRKKGFEGASILMDHVVMKVGQNRDCLDKVLQIMKEQEYLHDVVMRMKENEEDKPFLKKPIYDGSHEKCLSQNLLAASPHSDITHDTKGHVPKQPPPKKWKREQEEIEREEEDEEEEVEVKEKEESVKINRKRTKTGDVLENIHRSFSKQPPKKRWKGKQGEEEDKEEEGEEEDEEEDDEGEVEDSVEIKTQNTGSSENKRKKGCTCS